jgi:exopolysaccharide biosynthesis polyprenyl glycosylphosphotransferase
LIFGYNQEVARLVQTLAKNPQLGYKVIKTIRQVQKIDLLEAIKKLEIDTLVLGQNFSSEKKIEKKIYPCLSLQITIWDLAKAYELIFQKIPLNFIDQAWLLENLSEGRKRLYDKTKRLLDIAFASFFLALTLPFWLLISLVIKLEDWGPIFYRQERIGKNNRVFILWKFRSMKKGAEAKRAVWAKEKDPRTTKTGKILRKTHLDELPQLINILRGDISFVGPRPERPEFVKRLEQKIPYYHLRHIIKPGFTGWAQIKFRYARSIMDSFEKFQYDLYYIKNRSLLLDLITLSKTFYLLFKK